MIELLFLLGVIALAVVVVPLIVAVGGSALWSLLVAETPETYLTDRASRRSLLRG